MTTPDPTLAQIHLAASVSGTQEVQALQKSINGVTAAEDKLAVSQEAVSRKGASYLAYLAKVEAAHGKTREEIMRATAQQRGVGAQAEPIIQSIVNKNEAQKQMQALAARQAEGAAMIAAMQQKVSGFGKTPEALTQERAAMLGVEEQAKKLSAQLALLNAVQAATTEAAAKEAARQAEGAAILASVQQKLDNFGKTSGQLLLEKAAMAGVGDQARTLTAELERLQAQQTAMAEATAREADVEAQRRAFIASLEQELLVRTKTRSEIQTMRAAELGVTAETETVRHALVQAGIDGEHSFQRMILSGGVFRELIVLIHESLIMGNWSRFGGSMMVLAERTGVSTAIFTAMGLSVIGAATSVIALTAAMFEGERQSTAFARAISLTGDFAGITEGQFNQMAESIGTEIPGSVLKARSAMLDLIKTGQFSGQTLEDVGRAAVEFSKYSGDSAEQSAAYFAQMKKGVADWAEKANESYHFLTVGQYDQIAALERLGQVQAAEKLAADDFYTQMSQTATQNLGAIEEAVNGVSIAFHNLWNYMESFGRMATPQSTLDALLIQKKNMQEYGQGSLYASMDPGAAATLADNRGPGAPASLPIATSMAQLDKQIAAARAAVAAANKAASAKSALDLVNQQSISASAGVENLVAPDDPLSKGMDQLYAWRKQLQAAIKAGTENPKADPNYQQNINFVNGGSVWQHAVAKIQYQYGRQAGSYGNDKQLNNIPLADTSRLQTQLSLMEQMAKATHKTETATLQLEIAQGKLSGFTQAQIGQLQTLATRHDQLVSAQEQVELNTRFTEKDNDILIDNAKLKQQLKQLQATGRVSDLSQIDQVNIEASRGDLVGLSPDELKQLRANALGNDTLTKEITDTKRTATYGTENAFSTYVDDATNAGAEINRVWTDTFTGMQDLLTRTLEGGQVGFRDFTRSIVTDLLSMEVQKNIMSPIVSALGSLGGGKNGAGFSSVIGDIGSFFSMSKFANGGIMTHLGSLPLHRYANGGIANTPQMAMFGEGRGPEAYVPLPDGRSIPVTMKGGANGGASGNVTNHITINSDGSTQVSAESSKRMAKAITVAVQQEMIRQAQDGGILSSTGGVFGGGAFQR